MDEFQYINGINRAEQLYFGSNTWFQTRPNYWKCTDFNVRLSSKGTMHVDRSLKNLTKHPGHNQVSIDEFIISRHFGI